ncbi:MAG: MOSC domain-containing protein [Calditrichia bacterium]
MNRLGRIVALSISRKKGTAKRNVNSVYLLEDWGMEGDAHAGKWHRQVSLLALESIQKMTAKGLIVRPGAFAENITTSGIDIYNLTIGEHLQIGDCLLEITQIGKECHNRCAIYQRVGDCVMPREGVFARVIRGGKIQRGEKIHVLPATLQRIPNSEKETA